MGLPRERRLSKRADFQYVFASGTVARSRMITIRACKTGLHTQPSRYGLSVGRRVGGAVVRNKVKRRLRDILRTLPAQTGWDVVVIAHPPSAVTNFRQLADTVSHLSYRIGFSNPS